MVNAPLHIITLVKWVPDAQLERRYNAEGRIDRSEGVLSELDEYPLEAALQLREAAQDREVRVTALTMGPAGSSTAVKKALQIGADDAYQLTDEALIGADIWASSVALKAAVEAVAGAGEFESGEPEYLVLTGMASEEGESGAIPPSWPNASGPMWSPTPPASSSSPSVSWSPAPAAPSRRRSRCACPPSSRSPTRPTTRATPTSRPSWRRRRSR